MSRHRRRHTPPPRPPAAPEVATLYIPTGWGLDDITAAIEAADRLGVRHLEVVLLRGRPRPGDRGRRCP